MSDSYDQNKSFDYSAVHMLTADFGGKHISHLES